MSPTANHSTPRRVAKSLRALRQPARLPQRMFRGGRTPHSTWYGSGMATLSGGDDRTSGVQSGSPQGVTRHCVDE